MKATPRALVDVVRLGRVALLYRRPDGKDAGYWDKAEKKWVSDPGIQKDVDHALARCEEARRA